MQHTHKHTHGGLVFPSNANQHFNTLLSDYHSPSSLGHLPLNGGEVCGTCVVCVLYRAESLAVEFETLLLIIIFELEAVALQKNFSNLCIAS